MKFIKKLAILLGIKKEWICIKGKQLKLTTNLGWTGDYFVKYKLVEGSFTKKDSYTGRLGDDLSINYTVFKPKTQKTKLLIWQNYKNKTTRYLVILNKKYNKNAFVDYE